MEKVTHIGIKKAAAAWKHLVFVASLANVVESSH